MSETEAYQSRSDYRRKQKILCAFSTDEIRSITASLRESICSQADSDLCGEFEAELKLRTATARKGDWIE